MYIAEKSPTIIYSENIDADWFKKNGGGIGFGNDDESIYDNDGYDVKGYDKNGVDRAGYHERQYDEESYKDVLDDFDTIFIPHLSIARNSSEVRYLEEEEVDLLLERAELENRIKSIDKRVESIRRSKVEFGVTTILDDNVVTAKRGFGFPR